jgi:DNA-binding LacI/PurR family transcriptional regulator
MSAKTLGGRIERGGVPAHIQVRDRILGQIRSGSLPLGSKLPSEPELARDLGVSRMTANKSIAQLVNEGWLLRERGRGTFVARDGETKAGAKVVLFLPVDTTYALDDFYFSALYWGLHDVFAEHQLVLELAHHHHRLQTSQTQEPSAYVGVGLTQTAAEALAKTAGDRPVVLLGCSWRIPGVATVDSDNLLGGSVAARHLVSLGHRRVLMLGAIPEASNTVDRLRGFAVGMKSSDMPFHDSQVLMLPDVEVTEDVLAKITQELRSATPATAIFAAGAKIAFQLTGHLQRLGFRCPQDVSVVAYDDPEFLRLSYPAVTTIRQPLADMAREAAEIVLTRLDTGEGEPPRRILDPTLILRGTTSVPRSFSEAL